MTELADIEFAPHLPDVKRLKFGTLQGFYRITPEWFYEFELYNVLSQNAIKIYFILQRYVSVIDYVGKLTNKTLAQRANISRKHICEYIKELTDVGLVYNMKKGWIRYYQLVLTKPPYINETYIEQIKAKKQQQLRQKNGTPYRDVMLNSRDVKEDTQLRGIQDTRWRGIL